MTVSAMPSVRALASATSVQAHMVVGDFLKRSLTSVKEAQSFLASTIYGINALDINQSLLVIAAITCISGLWSWSLKTLETKFPKTVKTAHLWLSNYVLNLIITLTCFCMVNRLTGPEFLQVFTSTLPWRFFYFSDLLLLLSDSLATVNNDADNGSSDALTSLWSNANCCHSLLFLAFQHHKDIEMILFLLGAFTRTTLLTSQGAFERKVPLLSVAYLSEIAVFMSMTAIDIFALNIPSHWKIMIQAVLYIVPVSLTLFGLFPKSAQSMWDKIKMRLKLTRKRRSR